MTYEMTEREADVRKRWNDGFSAGQIAGQTGHSRNTVVGIINKLKHKGIAVRGLGKDGQNRGRLQHDPKKPAPVSETMPPAEEVEEYATVEEKPKPKKDQLGDFAYQKIPFLDRQHLFRAPDQRDIPFDGTSRTCCQWPAWGLEHKTGPMCGAPVDRHSTSRYCGFHQKKAYSPRVK